MFFYVLIHLTHWRLVFRVYIRGWRCVHSRCFLHRCPLARQLSARPTTSCYREAHMRTKCNRSDWNTCWQQELLGEVLVHVRCAMSILELKKMLVLCRRNPVPSTCISPESLWNSTAEQKAAARQLFWTTRKLCGWGARQHGGRRAHTDVPQPSLGWADVHPTHIETVMI